MGGRRAWPRARETMITAFPGSVVCLHHLLMPLLQVNESLLHATYGALVLPVWRGQGRNGFSRCTLFNKRDGAPSHRRPSCDGFFCRSRSLRVRYWTPPVYRARYRCAVSRCSLPICSRCRVMFLSLGPCEARVGVLRCAPLPLHLITIL